MVTASGVRIGWAELPSHVRAAIEEGPAWLDTLALLINVRLHGGHDTSALLTRCAADAGADRDELLAVLAGFGGYFADIARRPPPRGLPTVRAFQRAQAGAVLSWLRDEKVVSGQSRA